MFLEERWKTCSLEEGTGDSGIKQELHEILFCCKAKMNLTTSFYLKTFKNIYTPWNRWTDNIHSIQTWQDNATDHPVLAKETIVENMDEIVDDDERDEGLFN